MAPAFAGATSPAISVWWPTDSTHVSGTQPFKAIVDGLDVSEYEMFWQVDNGSWVWMDNNYNGSPHKEASADVGSWTWHGNGPYVVNFIVRQNGTVGASNDNNNSGSEYD